MAQFRLQSPYIGLAEIGRWNVVSLTSEMKRTEIDFSSEITVGSKSASFNLKVKANLKKIV